MISFTGLTISFTQFDTDIGMSFDTISHDLRMVTLGSWQQQFGTQVEDFNDGSE